MQIIITWHMIIFIFAFYFITKYLSASLKKLMTGCQDPFNPLYSYRDYPTWRQGYNRGRRDIIKKVSKMLADFQSTNNEILERYSNTADKRRTESKDQPDI